jgi:hypothetical protein
MSLVWRKNLLEKNGKRGKNFARKTQKKIFRKNENLTGKNKSINATISH